MVDVSVYENLPDEPELAFVVLEEEFRRDFEALIRQADPNERHDVYWAQYIADVQATIDELRLEYTGIHRVDAAVRDLSWEQFVDFRHAVRSYTSKIKIRMGRKVKDFSVRLDGNVKSKLRQLLEQVKKQSVISMFLRIRETPCLLVSRHWKLKSIVIALDLRS